MKIVNQSCSLIKGETPLKHIELVGRTCYKSEDCITDTSAEKFVKGLINRQHWAILEHFTIYITMNSEWFLTQFLKECFWNSLDSKKDGAQDTEQFTFINWSYGDKPLLSGSFRAFHDLLLRTMKNPKHVYAVNYLATILKCHYPLVFGDINTDAVGVDFSSSGVELITGDDVCKIYEERPDIIKKHLTHTLHFVTDRGVSHEFVRHRNCAFAQESTRYCNYCKDKFGNEITVIEPCFWLKDRSEKDNNMHDYWVGACEDAEAMYFQLIRNGATPQEARTVLPNSLKTELIITATEKEWQHIINLRYHGTTGAPHPQIKEAMANALPILTEVSRGRLI